MAVMAVREGLEFESDIESDAAPLARPVMALLDGGVDVHSLRDLTRGGLASSLCEIAATSRLDLAIEERLVPVREDVRSACELLGLDPFYVANEGRFIAFVTPSDEEKALSILRSDPLGREARRIGKVAGGTTGLVTLKSAIGATRILDMLSGEQLPRIC
jgi:hydrogenase expression/formation protein HypE